MAQGLLGGGMNFGQWQHAGFPDKPQAPSQSMFGQGMDQNGQMAALMDYIRKQQGGGGGQMFGGGKPGGGGGAGGGKEEKPGGTDVVKSSEQIAAEQATAAAAKAGGQSGQAVPFSWEAAVDRGATAGDMGSYMGNLWDRYGGTSNAYEIPWQKFFGGKNDGKGGFGLGGDQSALLDYLRKNGGYR